MDRIDAAPSGGRPEPFLIMFQKSVMPNRENGNDAETIIAASVKVEGEFVSQGNVLIEGEVQGSLKTEKNLRVGERARISADVSAASVSVAGEIRGNITASERLDLDPTARIFGDIRTKVLAVSPGATVSGRVTMGAEAEEKPRVAAKAERTRLTAKVDEPSAEEEKAKSAVASILGR
jgi:cytoskeletal protein CcmA (bactofilin family)